jgi:hypothetical protein
LQAEGLPHQVVAVSSYEQLRQKCEDYVRAHSDIKHIIMINCGAVIDLRNEIFQNNMLSPQQSVYVIDTNRPIHLNNVFDWPQVDDLEPPAPNASGSIYVVASERNNTLDIIKKINASTWLNRNEDFRNEMLYQVRNCAVTLTEEDPLENLEEEEDDNEGDNFANLDDDELRDFIVSDPDDNIDDEDDDYMADDIGFIDGDDESQQLPPVRLRLKNRDVYSKSEYDDLMEIMNYYTLSSSTIPSCVVLYETIAASTARQIISENNKSIHNSILWAIIIGFTSHYMDRKLSHGKYDDLVNKFATTVITNNNHYRSTILTTSGNVTETTSEVRIIYESEDYIFTLYRHWNLYSAMLNSPHLYAHYNDWKNDTERVAQFLAKIGVPLVDCKNPYITMVPEMRDTFKSGIKNYGHILSKEPLTQRTFIRHYGTDFEASAFDMVYILKSLMNQPITACQKLESVVDNKIWDTNWHVAQEALNGSIKILQQGIKVAIASQRKIVQQVKYIITSQSLKQDDLAVNVNIGRSLALDSGFYVTDNMQQQRNGSSDSMNETESSHLYVLTPNGLLELSQLLMSVLEKMKAYRKPLIVFAPSNTQKELVYGLTSGKRYQNKNPFAYAFRKAARTVGIQILPVGFMQGMVEVNRNEKLNMMSGLMHEFQMSLRADR